MTSRWSVRRIPFWRIYWSKRSLTSWFIALEIMKVMMEMFFPSGYLFRIAPLNVRPT
jgi:hypothetical protein